MVLDSNGVEKFNGWGRHDVPWEMYRHVNGGGGVNCYYFPGGVSCTSFGTDYALATAGQMSIVPFVWPGGMCDEIAVRLSTSAGTNLSRVGIYDNVSDINCTPRKLLVGSTAFSATGASAKYSYSISPALQLKAGEMYHAAIITDGNGTAPQAYRGNDITVQTPFGGLGAGSVSAVGFWATYPYGPLPTYCPAVTARLTNIIAFGLRISG